MSLRELTEQALLQHYVQAAVLINRRGEILNIYDRTAKYLEPAPGDATVNILPMAREGLRQELSLCRSENSSIIFSKRFSAVTSGKSTMR